MEKKTIGQFLSALRKAGGMTQKELAEKLHVSDKAVSRWERDECAPDLSLIPVIADIFGVTSDELLRGERRPASSADNPADAQGEDKKFSAKSRREIKYLMNKMLTQYKMQLLIAAAVALVGGVIGLICNGFCYALLGLGIAVIFYIGAAACIAVFTLLTCARVDWEEFDGNEAKQYKKSIIYSVFVTGCVIFAVICYASLPLADVDNAYAGISWEYMRSTYDYITLLFLLIAAAAWTVMRAALIRLGLVKPLLNVKCNVKGNLPLLGKTAAWLALSLLLTAAAHAGFHLYADAHMLTAGRPFVSRSDFIAYMQTPKHDVTYFDPLGPSYEGAFDMRETRSDVAVSPSDWSEYVKEEDYDYFYYDDQSGQTYYPATVVLSPKDGRELFRYIYRNFDVQHVVFSDTDELLPIRVYTQNDFTYHDTIVATVNTAFVILYFIEFGAAVGIYLRKRPKQ